MASPRPSRLAATLLLLTLLPAAAAQDAAASTPPAVQAACVSFSVMVLASADAVEFEATCETGCAWQRLGARYAVPAGSFQVTDAGIRPATAADRVDETEGGTRFDIRLTATPDGVEARCEHGCSWRSVRASYPNGRYRITEQGIWPLLP